MHDRYAPTPGTAACPHCAADIATPDNFVRGYPAIQRALIDLVCPLGHVWHEVRTGASCHRYWEVLDTEAPDGPHPDPASAVRLPASPRAPRAASTPA